VFFGFYTMVKVEKRMRMNYQEGNRMEGDVADKTELPTIPADTDRGQGDGFALKDSHHTRADLRLARRAVLNKWPMKDADRAHLHAKMIELADSPDDRVAVAAVKLGTDMNRQNIAVDLEEDKAERLDAGKPTENINHGVKFIKGVDGSGI
jgi:hypothetical protein